MIEQRIVVLYRDRHWLALSKPVGVATTEAKGLSSLVERARAELDTRSELLHPLSRLDVGVTGVVLFALTRAASERANRARESHRYARVYHALVSPAPAEARAEYRWPIGVDPRTPERRVTEGARAMLAAHSSMSVREQREQVAWIELVPHTGRTHQLRVHCAAAGHPILGDRLYRGLLRLTRADGTVLAAARPMLHLARVSVGDELTVECPWPEDMSTFWERVEPLT